MVKNNLSLFIETILDAPLWVQEAVYTDIKNNLELKINGITKNPIEDELYPVFIPALTFKGKKELETHEHNLDFNFYKYFDCVNNGLRVIDITLNNFWTLEESSKYLAESIKYEYIKAPSNAVLHASIFYLGNEIRLGEYIKRINKINIEELDEVLRKQKKHNDENPNAKLKIGEILVDMGFVVNNDIEKILYMKDEAKRRFILSNDMKAPAKSESVNYDELQQKIQKLSQENQLLKDKLRAIFNIQIKQAPKQ